jgi:transposase
MNNSKKTYTPQFKTKVALEALSQASTITELASKHQVHHTQIIAWKKHLLKNAPDIFSDKRKKVDKTKDQEIEQLYKKVGQYSIELDWLKKKSGLET